jgi:hypothetical protein
MGEGLCRKKQLFTRKGRCELEALKLDKWASRQRQELLHMLDQLDASLAQFDQAVNEQAAANAEAVRLMDAPRSVGDHPPEQRRRGSHWRRSCFLLTVYRSHPASARLRFQWPRRIRGDGVA